MCGWNGQALDQITWSTVESAADEPRKSGQSHEWMDIATEGSREKGTVGGQKGLGQPSTNTAWGECSQVSETRTTWGLRGLLGVRIIFEAKANLDFLPGSAKYQDKVTGGPEQIRGSS